MGEAPLKSLLRMPGFTIKSIASEGGRTTAIIKSENHSIEDVDRFKSLVQNRGFIVLEILNQT